MGEAVQTQALGFLFGMALLYAFQAHATQRRKGGDIPYVGHLLGVASTVIEAGGDEEQAIAALLHDAVEDQGGEWRQREIGTLFGERVARIVQECSDDAPGTVPRDETNWRPRKEEYLRYLREGASNEARLVSLADKLFKARSVLYDLQRDGDQVWTRFRKPREEQLWYYRALAETFHDVVTDPRLRPLIDDLTNVIRDIEALA